MLIPFTLNAEGMDVSVRVGSGVLVAGGLVSVGGDTGVGDSVGVLEQAERNMPRARTRVVKTRTGLFFISLIIPTFQ
jgi:predicted ATP-dependent serine protease